MNYTNLPEPKMENYSWSEMFKNHIDSGELRNLHSPLSHLSCKHHPEEEFVEHPKTDCEICYYLYWENDDTRGYHNSINKIYYESASQSLVTDLMLTYKTKYENLEYLFSSIIDRSNVKLTEEENKLLLEIYSYNYKTT